MFYLFQLGLVEHGFVLNVLRGVRWRWQDGGVSWSPLGVVFGNSSATEKVVVGNTAPVQVRSTGRILLPFCRDNLDLFLTYSDDGASFVLPALGL